jgi:hypothetical protein
MSDGPARDDITIDQLEEMLTDLAASSETPADGTSGSDPDDGPSPEPSAHAGDADGEEDGDPRPLAWNGADRRTDAETPASEEINAAVRLLAHKGVILRRDYRDEYDVLVREADTARRILATPWLLDMRVDERRRLVHLVSLEDPDGRRRHDNLMKRSSSLNFWESFVLLNLREYYTRNEFDETRGGFVRISFGEMRSLVSRRLAGQSSVSKFEDRLRAALRRLAEAQIVEMERGDESTWTILPTIAHVASADQMMRLLDEYSAYLDRLEDARKKDA